MYTASVAGTVELTRLERAELNYVKEYYDHCPLPEKKSLGLDYMHNGRYCCFAMPAHDILAFNRVLGLGIDEPVSRRALQQVIAYYRSMEVPRFFVQVPPFASPDNFHEILTDKGFVHYNNWVKSGKELSLPVIPLQYNLTVREAGKSDRETVAAVIAKAFDFPINIGTLFSGTLGLPGWKFYLVFDEEQPVAAGGLYLSGKTAGLAIAGTLPEHRGKKAQRVLIQQRMAEALRSGCEFISVETAEDKPEKPGLSYQNMLKEGFTPLYLRANYIFYTA